MQVEVWKQLGPFGLQKCVDEQVIEINENIPIKEIVNIESNTGNKFDKIGQLNIQNTLHGIGKKTFHQGSFQEGNFTNGKLHLFGRIIFRSGAYYIGEWKNGQFHGKGKRMYSDGSIEEGEWENDQFIG